MKYFCENVKSDRKAIYEKYRQGYLYSYISSRSITGKYLLCIFTCPKQNSSQSMPAVNTIIPTFSDSKISTNKVSSGLFLDFEVPTDYTVKKSDVSGPELIDYGYGKISNQSIILQGSLVNGMPNPHIEIDVSKTFPTTIEPTTIEHTPPTSIGDFGDGGCEVGDLEKNDQFTDPLFKNKVKALMEITPQIEKIPTCLDKINPSNSLEGGIDITYNGLALNDGSVGSIFIDCQEIDNTNACESVLPNIVSSITIH